MCSGRLRPLHIFLSDAMMKNPSDSRTAGICQSVRSNWELQHRQPQNKAELLEALSDEQKELLEKFCATEIELNGISEREAFTAGFKIALRLAAEAFYEADNE